MSALELQLSVTKAEQALDRFATKLSRLQSQLSNFNATNVNKVLSQLSTHRGISPAVVSGISNTNRQLQLLTQQANNAARAMQALGNASSGAGGGIRSMTGSLGGLGGALAGLGFVGVIASMKEFISSSIEAANKIKTFENVMTSVRGSSSAAGKELDFLRGVADRNGASMEAMITSYGNFAAASANVGFSVAETQEVFENMFGVFRVLNLSTQEQGFAFLALQQMMAKGVVSMEELRRQLGERMPTAFDTMARAVGVSQGELSKLISTGQVTSDVLLEFSRIAKNDFAAGLESASKSGQASMQRLANAWFEFQAEFGKGFITGIQPGIDALTKWLGDEDMINSAEAWGERIGTAFSGLLQIIPGVVSAWKEIALVAGVLAASPIVGAIASMAAAFARLFLAVNPIARAITIVVTAGSLLGGVLGNLFSETEKVAAATAYSTNALREQAAALNVSAQASEERVTAIRAEKQALVEKLQAEFAAAQASAQQLSSVQAMTVAERENLGITDQMVQYLEAKVAAQVQDMVATQGALQATQQKLVAEQGHAATLQETIGKTQAAARMEELLSGQLTASVPIIGTHTEAVNATNTALTATTGASQQASTGIQSFYGILEAAGSYFSTFIDWVNNAIDALLEFIGAKSDAGVSGGDAAAAASGEGGGVAVDGFRYGGLTNNAARSRYNVSTAAFANAPAFASGTPNTSGGFPAILHPNEAVVPLPDGRTIPVALSGAQGGQGGNPADTILLSNILDNARKTRIAAESFNQGLKDFTTVLHTDSGQVIMQLDRLYKQSFDTERTVVSMFKDLTALVDKISKIKSTPAPSPSSPSPVSPPTGGDTTGGGTGGGLGGGGGNLVGPGTVDPSSISPQEAWALSHGYLPDGWTKLIESGGAGTNGYNVTYVIFDENGNQYLGGGGSSLGFAKGSPNAFDDAMNGGANVTIHPDEAVVPLPDGRSVPVDFGSSLDARLAELAAAVTARPDKKQNTRERGDVYVNMTVNTPDADSFRRSSDQLAQELRAKMDKATRQFGNRNLRDDPTRRPS